MTQPNPTCYQMSASAISAFKHCPTRFRLAYREGLRPAQDTDALRMGTNWHALHEVYQTTVRETGDDDDALTAVSDYLTETYQEVPSWKSVAEWEVERIVLLRSFLCYLWYWDAQPIEYLADELCFDLPLIDPVIGMPLPMSEVKNVGKIDHVIRYNGMVGNLERKSTAQSVDPSSRYWERLQKDTQVSNYALAFADMKAAGLEQFGINGVGPDERTGNTLYDVWHKPSSKPKDLTQKDTKSLIEGGEYFGETFKVEVETGQVPTTKTDKDGAVIGAGECEEGIVGITVDGEPAEWSPGARAGTVTLKETPQMFGARLSADIQERPEFYFARKEIPRTQADLIKYRRELFNIYQAQKMYAKTDCWYENENACTATFNCQYIPICYGPGADAVCDGKTTPANFKRIFVDLTVKDTDPDA